MFTWGGVVVDALHGKVKNDFTQLYYATKEWKIEMSTVHTL